jgi:hypothetical protein
MRPFDVLRGAAKKQRELVELGELYNRLQAYVGEAEEQRNELCTKAVASVFNLSINETRGIVEEAAYQLCLTLLAIEGHLYLPEVEINKQRTMTETWELTAKIKRALVPFEEQSKKKLIEHAFTKLVERISDGLPQISIMAEDEWASLSVPLYVLLPDPVRAIETVIGVVFNEELIQTGFFEHLRFRLNYNINIASGINPVDPNASRKVVILPSKANMTTDELIATYLDATPFTDFFQTPLPFSIPMAARFEHMHVVGGSGHGKTQLLQHLILHDLDQLREGRGTIIVIDSQGDMPRNTLSLLSVGEMADRLVLIDPNDIEYLPALNLFDFGLERLARYNAVEREKLVNGAIALYEYLFGALLGAELTQRQGVIFRFLARLMMTVRGATIHTLMQFMEDPNTTRPHLHKLDFVSRRFFETQFFSKTFDDTRQQILTRLWGVLSNSVLERMFANERNKLDLFEAVNRGSIILINTAKDLLKQEGCEILGRFFIALICQAAQERASIPEDRRRSTFVYIDEAHDYFDESIENLLNQARKYKVGLVLAHQNLDQFEMRLRSTVAASTSIKVVGGLSAKDTGVFSREMHCEPEFLQGMRKHRDRTEFACFVRNHTPQPIRLTVPLGEMERRPKLTDAQYAVIIERNRQRYSTSGTEYEGEADRQTNTGGDDLGTPDLL